MVCLLRGLGEGLGAARGLGGTGEGVWNFDFFEFFEFCSFCFLLFSSWVLAFSFSFLLNLQIWPTQMPLVNIAFVAIEDFHKYWWAVVPCTQVVQECVPAVPDTPGPANPSHRILRKGAPTTPEPAGPNPAQRVLESGAPTTPDSHLAPLGKRPRNPSLRVRFMQPAVSPCTLHMGATHKCSWLEARA